MGDSVAALWESELLRARQWLVANCKDKQQENEQLFQRVKMHMGFQDHQRSLQSAEVASEDENDMALEFLGDVDVSDMDALLQVEAAKAAAAVETKETSLLSTRDLMMPLDMPIDLVAPKLKLQPVSELDPKQGIAGVTLGNEAGVHELMQELALDVTQLKQMEIEECKTEENTPPHILKNCGGTNKTASDGTEQFNYMREISSKSPQAPHKKKAETSATMQQDDVADEMLSWVSGYRDPEVIRRKEIIQRKRKYTPRDDSMSSGYSPAEDDEMSDLEENEVVVLLSDDCLDNEEARQCVKQKRKRLRQADGPPTKKKSRSRKPTITRKLTQQSRTIQNTDNVQVASSAESEAKHVLATTCVEADSTSTPCRPVELLCNEGVREANGKGSISKVVEHKSTNSHGVDGSSNAPELEKTMELTVLRDCFQKESDVNKVQQKRGSESELSMAAPLLADSEAGSGYTACESVSSDRTAFESSITVGGSIVNEKADTDNADLSDTGTIYLKDEERPFQTERYHEEATATTSEEATATTSEAVVDSDITAELEDAKRVDRLPNGDVEQSVELDDEDVSEAETEILEDNESNTDDLGLNYSDDSDVESSKQVNQKNDSVDVQRDASGSKKGGTESETKSTHGRHSSADPKQELSTNQKKDNVSALTAGVQQFFDFAPLKSKSKVKIVSSTAPKPLPLHSYTLTHPKVGNNNAEEAFIQSKKAQVVPTTPSIGSNGLRPMKRSIATSTTRKGKYLVTRRCTKMLDDVSEIQRQPKRQYAMVTTKNSRSNDTNDLDDEPLAILANELSNNSEDTPQARYLSYAGAMNTEEPPSYVANTPRIVSKSRFSRGGGLHFSSSAAPIFSTTSTGWQSKLPDKDVSAGGYRREPQISIYDALHMDKEESAIEICKVTGYKRSSRFKKMQEEAVWNGTPMVKSQLQDKDWDKMPIPKKKKQTHQADEDVLLQPSKASDVGGKSRNKRRKKTLASPIKKSGSSYYGPQISQVATSDKHDSSSRGRHGRESSNCRREDDRKKKRSPSLPSRDRDHYDKKYRVRDDRGRKGSLRSRSRSLSPRRRDYSNNRKRYRSRSRSWSREKSSDRDHRRSDQTGSISRGRDCHPEKNGKRRSFSPKKRDPSKKKTLDEPPKLDEVYETGKIEDIGRSAKKQKFSHSTTRMMTRSALKKEVEDIRFDLDSIPVDEALMTRQVYVTGLNPTVCAEQMEEDFARFGVGVDRETGFPSIEVFACQRNYLGRGDARVTFKTEEGAQEAVEELNSKNVKNSMIHVRRMDVHTQRILTTQFQAVRDTWKCTKTHCRADVSVWNAKCDKCGRKRVYGPSNIKIGAESWLCSLCFTSNESFATNCCGCMEALPEIDRSTFYSS
ncbi:unnamed protein product [Peronospora destructor]|uniref:RRM domain-containing protein n=1 Tax=Peronospora destructor TaxID=86335 RepID=A0AAV0TSQ7_9STRA|nr:unnamed protein product [Peronospora destructor]